MNEKITRVVFRKWFTAAILVVVTLLMLLLLPGDSHALTLEQQPLVGLKGVYVIATVDSSTQKEIELLGLTKDEIQKDTELRLRKSGVKVLTDKEWGTTLGMPSLMVNLTAFTYLGGLCVYSVRIELFEGVTLARGGQTIASVWEANYIGMVGTKSIRTVRDNVGDRIDNFINDYLAANPK